MTATTDLRALLAAALDDPRWRDDVDGDWLERQLRAILTAAHPDPVRHYANCRGGGDTCECEYTAWLEAEPPLPQRIAAHPDPAADRVDLDAVRREAGGVDFVRMHHGVCPSCHEVKFIGHGPLCLDCLDAVANPDGSDGR
jgi:hypothetical protein